MKVQGILNSHVSERQLLIIRANETLSAIRNLTVVICPFSSNNSYATQLQRIDKSVDLQNAN